MHVQTLQLSSVSQVSPGNLVTPSFNLGNKDYGKNMVDVTIIFKSFLKILTCLLGNSDNLLYYFPSFLFFGTFFGVRLRYFGFLVSDLFKNTFI